MNMYVKQIIIHKIKIDTGIKGGTVAYIILYILII